MAIPLTGAGGLFTRVGHILGILNSINTYRGTTVPPKVDTLFADYASTDQPAVTNIYTFRDSFQAAMSGLPSQLRTIAQSTLAMMANDSSPLPNQGSVPQALAVLIAQMVATAQSVQSSAVGGSVAYGGSNNGNGKAYLTLLGGDGAAQEDSFAEAIAGTCTADAQSGGAAAGQEVFSFKAPQAAQDVLSWTFPAGSGSAASARCLDAAQQQTAAGNMVNNGRFETWTVANVPDGWTIGTGVAGTSVKQNTSTFYDGLSSLEIVGNGSELTTLYQEFSQPSVVGATSARVAPLTQYAFNCYAKVNSAPGAGVLRVALVDGAGTVIVDAKGTANSFTTALTGIGTTFVPVQGFFRTPRVLPASVRLQLRLTTALTAAISLYVDHMAFGTPTRLYPGGPSVALFSASTPFIAGDTITLTVTNDRAGGFQTGFDKLFGMRQRGLLLPSSGSPTISESLIT